MFITEQLYRKINKLYYHGQSYKDRDNSLVEFNNCYYLTPDPYYAFNYSGINGYIKILKLKQNLNLCNFNSKQDQKILETYIRKHNTILSVEDINDLKYNDWIDVFDNIENREIFLDLLKALGYDGFFNYENTNNLSRFYLKDKQPGFPAIGIFDTNNLIEIKTLYKINEFLEIDRIKNIFKKEKEFLKNQLFNLYQKEGPLSSENVNKLLKRNSIKYYIDLLTEGDIIKILNTFNPDEIKESLNKKKRNMRIHLKDWWMREPSEKELKIFWDKHKSL